MITMFRCRLCKRTTALSLCSAATIWSSCSCERISSPTVVAWCVYDRSVSICFSTTLSLLQAMLVLRQVPYPVPRRTPPHLTSFPGDPMPFGILGGGHWSGPRKGTGPDVRHRRGRNASSLQSRFYWLRCADKSRLILTRGSRVMVTKSSSRTLATFSNAGLFSFSA